MKVLFDNEIVTIQDQLAIIEMLKKSGFKTYNLVNNEYKEVSFNSHHFAANFNVMRHGGLDVFFIKNIKTIHPMKFCFSIVYGPPMFLEPHSEILNRLENERETKPTNTFGAVQTIKKNQPTN